MEAVVEPESEQEVVEVLVVAVAERQTFWLPNH